MSAFGKKYHPGFDYLYDKGLMKYSKEQDRYILPKAGTSVNGNTMMRIAEFLFTNTGKRKKGRDLSLPLPMMYGQKSSLKKRLQKKDKITVPTLLGERMISSVPSVIKTRSEHRYTRPTVDEDKMRNIVGSSFNQHDLSYWNISYLRNAVYPYRYVFRCTDAQGNIPPRFEFKAGHLEERISYIKKHVFEDKMIPLSLLFKKKLTSPEVIFGGSIVLKYRTVRGETFTQGSFISWVRNFKDNKKFKEHLLYSFVRELRDHLNKIDKGNRLGSHEDFSFVGLQSVSILSWTNPKKMPSHYKAYLRSD